MVVQGIEQIRSRGIAGQLKEASVATPSTELTQDLICFCVTAEAKKSAMVNGKKKSTRLSPSRAIDMNIKGKIESIGTETKRNEIIQRYEGIMLVAI